MCMGMWRSGIPKLLTSGEFSTQDQLVAALSAEGHAVNQATVSRELRALGVRKVDGVYRLPERASVGAPIRSFVVTGKGCLAVVKTGPAHAMVVAQSIDGAEIDGVLGTVAGDDTVFVATTGKGGSRRLAEWLGVRSTPDDDT